MTPGREYGIGKYGRRTYDKDRQANWVPEPAQADVWVPEPDNVQIWTPEV